MKNILKDWKLNKKFSKYPQGYDMGIHYNHKSKAGDRKMQKALKLKMKAEARKQKREEKQAELDEEEMRKLEELTRPDKSTVE